MHRFTALILVVAMPMCCCVLNVAAGSSCCDPSPKIERISCCSPVSCESEPAEATPVELPCVGDDCQCCLKAPSLVENWTPPVDSFGTDLMTPHWVVGQERSSQDRTAVCHSSLPPPWPDDSGPVRGQTILQI